MAVDIHLILLTCCDGRVVKASDSKSDGFSRVGSNPTRSAPLFFLTLFPETLDRCRIPCSTWRSLPERWHRPWLSSLAVIERRTSLSVASRSMAGLSNMTGSLDAGVLNGSGTGGVEMARALSSMQVRNEQFRQLYEQLKQEYSTLSDAYADCQRTLEKSTEDNRQMQEKFKNLLDKLQMDNRKKQSQIEEMKTQVESVLLHLGVQALLCRCFPVVSSCSTIVKSIRFEIGSRRRSKVLTNQPCNN